MTYYIVKLEDIATLSENEYIELFNRCIENPDTLRISNDGLLTILKSTVELNVQIQGSYTKNEILEILTGENWIEVE